MQEQCDSLNAMEPHAGWKGIESMRTRSTTHRFHTVRHEPMEAFDEEQEAEHNDEGYVEIVPEYCKRQKRFSHEHPCLVIEPLIKAPR